MVPSSLQSLQLALREFLLNPDNIEKQNQLVSTSVTVFHDACKQFARTAEPKGMEDILPEIARILEPLIKTLRLSCEDKKSLNAYLSLLSSTSLPKVTEEDQAHAFHAINLIYNYEDYLAYLSQEETIITTVAAKNATHPKQRNNTPEVNQLKELLHQLDVNARAHQKSTPKIASLLKTTHQVLAEQTTQYFSFAPSQNPTNFPLSITEIRQTCRTTKKELDRQLMINRIIFNAEAAAVGLIVFYLFYLLITAAKRQSIFLKPPEHAAIQHSIKNIDNLTCFFTQTKPDSNNSNSNSTMIASIKK